MCTPVRMTFAIAIAIALAAVSSRNPMNVRAAERTVEVTVRCVTERGQPYVEAAIENETGAELQIVLIRPLAHPGQTFPSSVAEYSLDDGDALTFSVPRLEPLSVGDGALVVTSAGVLRVECNVEQPEHRVSKSLRLDSSANDDDALTEEAVTNSAEMLGDLEYEYDLDALYQLLHSDVREELSFEALACWYIDEYAPLTAPGKVTVSDVWFEPWIWGVTGETYRDSAGLAYEQEFETGSGGPDGPQVAIYSGEQHLAFDDGHWRWFFGGSQEFIDSLRTDCGARILE